MGKVNQRILNIIDRQIEAQPSITSQEIKERNLQLLVGVAEQTVREYLKK